MKSRGFTLIELLVVIAIIGILSSVVLASLNTARARARDSKRLSDLHQVQLALELYRSSNTSYPVTSGWRGECSQYGGYNAPTGANGWVPNLAPDYIPTLPTNIVSAGACYLYYSNGTDYMILAHATVETNSGASNPAKRPAEAPSYYSYAIYTAGAVAW